MDFWKEKNVYTEWVYVLDVHCCATSVEVAQQFLLDDDIKYFRRNE